MRTAGAKRSARRGHPVRTADRQDRTIASTPKAAPVPIAAHRRPRMRIAHRPRRLPMQRADRRQAISHRPRRLSARRSNGKDYKDAA